MGSLPDVERRCTIRSQRQVNQVKELSALYWHRCNLLLRYMDGSFEGVKWTQLVVGQSVGE